MAKFHLNPKGAPGVCRARKTCPYGDLEKDHFGSEEEARKAYESRMEKAEIPLMKLRVYDYKILKTANLTASDFTVREEDGSLKSFGSLKEAADYAVANGRLEIVGVTKSDYVEPAEAKEEKKYWGTKLNDFEEDQYYASDKGVWIYSSHPNIDRPRTAHQKAVAEYWEENFKYWNTAWLNPDEAEGRCSDSADDFARWAKNNGHEASILEVHNGENTHTVTVFNDPQEGEVVVDFTARQFDADAPVPAYETREQFMEARNWRVVSEEKL